VAASLAFVMDQAVDSPEPVARSAYRLMLYSRIPAKVLDLPTRFFSRVFLGNLGNLGHLSGVVCRVSLGRRHSHVHSVTDVTDVSSMSDESF
jgi:hypothetical protein